MIADAVYLAVAGIGFCHAAGRSMLSSGLTTLVAQAWIRRRRGSRRNASALIKNP